MEFERIKDWDYQAMYQLGTMCYDGIGCKKDVVRKMCSFVFILYYQCLSLYNSIMFISNSTTPIFR